MGFQRILSILHIAVPPTADHKPNSQVSQPSFPMFHRSSILIGAMPYIAAFVENKAGKEVIAWHK
jgi:hypothetical protein